MNLQKRYNWFEWTQRVPIRCFIKSKSGRSIGRMETEEKTENKDEDKQ